MKIAFLSRYQETNKRGVETFAQELSDRLSKKHEIDLLSGSEADNLGRILSGNYDVVVPLNGRLQSLKVSLGRLRKKYKVLISGHSGIGRDDLWNLVITRPDVFVALTEHMYSWAKSWGFGIKIEKIPNGIDLFKFTPIGEKIEFDLPSPIILSVGALVWYKHHEKVVEAVSRLQKGSLLIVGEGEEKDNLIKLASQKLPDRFKIISANYSDMPSIYRSVDLFTLPSWDREAFGIVYLEAMATNLPVVAPNDESRREIVGTGGLLVNPEDVDKYSQGLVKALNTKWGDKPCHQAQKFSWDIVSKSYDELFGRMVDE